MVVWGFTAGLLDALLTLGAWAPPWAEDAPVDEELLASLVSGALAPTATGDVAAEEIDG